MRLTADEKAEVIRLVISSPEGVNKTLRSLGIHKRTFYNWYHAYSRDGIDGLLPKGRSSRQWNRIPDQERQLIVDVALEHTDLSPRELAASSVTLMVISSMGSHFSPFISLMITLGCPT
jgi:putative transposase